MVLRLMLLVAWLVPATVLAQAPVRQLDGAATLVERLEAAVIAGDREAILALAPGATNREPLDEFASLIASPPPTRAVVTERDRAPLSEGGFRVILEIFTERGNEGRLGTWRIDARAGTRPEDPWTIATVERLSIVAGLYRLSLDTAKTYEVRNLTVTGPDLALHLNSGIAFVAETPTGPTAVVLLGKGQMRFTPPDPTERTQLRIFNGDETFTQEFDAAFIRVNPLEFASKFNAASLVPRGSAGSEFRRASAFFDDYVGRSLQLDLSDISPDRWSLTPPYGDLIAEVRTRKHGTLTYTRSGNEAEDISVFDRKRRKNIAVYASRDKLAERGRFYSEDDLVEYDVLSYEIETEIAPDRAALAGMTRVKIRILEPGLTSLTLRLAESLSVRGVFSPQFGRLLHLRVIGQNSVIVNTPSPLAAGAQLTLEVRYSGRVVPQTIEREALDVAGQDIQEPPIPLEPRYLYSHRSYWYAQSTVSDYATARLRIIVPSNLGVVATGDAVGPPAPPPGVAEGRARHMFVFEATKPARYFGCVISRFDRVATGTLRLPAPADPEDIALSVHANPRQVGRSRDALEKARAIMEFYASIVGDAPYPSFAMAITESDRPGGHSPPYFVVLNQVVLGSTLVWRNDPVSFENYPTFFIAHEVAHQWWGQAVGWKNYHEQWISEGFSQYFAALYAEKERPGNVLSNLLRQMRHTAIGASSQGPIYLGYRLGHIQSDERVFRAILYNKGAMVLHMLRRLVGDETFFKGLRAFYQEWKFKKAGTNDFRIAIERASGRDLSRFFEVWVYGSEIPRVKFSYHTQRDEATLRMEQRGLVADVPVTATITYTSGASEEVVMRLSERLTELRVPLKGPVRTIVANADNAALVEIDR